MRATSLPARLGLSCAVLLTSGCGGAPETRPASTPPATSAPTPASKAAQSGPVLQGEKDLPESAYKIEWGTFEVPATLRPGSSEAVAVIVKNASSSSWPSGLGASGMYSVRLGHRWLRVPQKGKAANAQPSEVVGYGDWRVELPHALAPGATVTLADTLVAPARPGRYVVQFDLVHEGVTWFADKGAAKKEARVTVQ